MTVTKDRIIARVSEEMELAPLEARRHVENVIKIIKNTLTQEQSVLISGFGKFSVRKKNPRQGRNPQTGEPMSLKGRQVVTFKCSGVLRKRISPDDPSNS
ncbi:MAG: integration host factor subunit alpha [Deltaproteobacteria bacterium]|jgi:integration host factor subunit alpha|nr:integration host factor subunit alpha [Deltaproteobacteria bacterium]